MKSINHRRLFITNSYISIFIVFSIMNTNRFKTRWFRIIRNTDKITVSSKI
nr:MAG TPA: hypothetical protein [Bacteriophage sp.]